MLFALDGAELKRLMEQVGGADPAAAPLGVGGNLAKLRAILDLARTLQSSFSIDEVLASVVDTALTITGAERGFLLLRAGPGAPLETRVARNRRGQNLRETRSARAARRDPARAGAPPRTAVDELRARWARKRRGRRTALPTWNCAA